MIELIKAIVLGIVQGITELADQQYWAYDPGQRVDAADRAGGRGGQ